MDRFSIPKPDPEYIPEADWQAECEAARRDAKDVADGERLAHPGKVEHDAPPTGDTDFGFTVGLALGFVAGTVLILVCFAWR
jgi:hypothetical protein